MLKKIIEFSIKNKLALWLFTAIIVASGLYSGLNMKMETIPNINIPIISVTTVYPGASPEQVSEEVTTPIEQSVKNLGGVEAFSSNSMSNVSSIILEYNFDKDISEAVTEVKEAIAKLDFPSNVEDVNVSKISIDAFPVFTASVSDEDRPFVELSDFVEKTILPEVEGVEGVASVTLAGQETQEVQVSFDKEKLTSYGLDEATIEQMIQASDIVFPLGIYPIGKEEVSVVVDGQLSTIKDLENIRIPNQSNPNLKIKDVATFEVVTVSDSISRTNGENTINLSVVKSAEANTVEVVNAVKEIAEELEKEHKGITITPTFDQGKPIEDSVTTMLEKAFIGGIFAVIIILLFLRDVKTTLISIVSIPLSLLIAILFLKQMDITLNIMTLGAMTVAIGRVIDDSIVVIENIYRRMSLKEETLKGKELITEATREMFIPILSSTIVTVAVFLPLGLVKGTVGELFLPFALTMVFSLLASLLVAITIVPMMAHIMFKHGLKHQKDHDKVGKLAKNYKRVLEWALNHKVVTSFSAVALLVASLFLIPAIGFNFLSSDQQKMMMVTYDPAPGVQQEEVETLALQVEEYFMDKEDVTLVDFSVGGDNPLNPTASKQALFYVEYDADFKDFEKEKDLVTEDLLEFSSEGEWGYQDTSGNLGGSGLTLYVYGENREEVEPIVNDILDIMNDSDEFENIESSLTDSFKEYRFLVDQNAVSQHGLTAAQVGLALNKQGNAPVLTTVEKDGKELNVYVKVDGKSYNSIKDMTKQTIATPFGTKVAVSELIKVEEGQAADTISKRDGKYYAEISADFTSDDIGSASSKLQKDIDELDMPSTAEVSFGGVTEQMNDAFTQLGLAILAAIAIVYLVLVITFGGGLAPFAILFSLPFTVIGALVALLVSGETITVTAFIGVLMLVGIVVTNAIVLVHRIIHKEEEGLSTREAILEAGTTRLRPILMTALATVGALAPLAVGVGGSGLISKGLGVTVIGGLISSTLLTLIVVPIVYEILMNAKNKTKRTKQPKQLNLKEVQASDVMIPRKEMTVLNVSDKLKENISIMKNNEASYFVVVNEDKDHVVGYVQSKEVFVSLFDGNTTSLETFIHPILSVSFETSAEELLRSMQKEQTPIAVLTDEFGGTIGFVTLEAILEKLVEEKE